MNRFSISGILFQLDMILCQNVSHLFLFVFCDGSQGEFKIQEDKKHRATYEALGDSEKKIQFFSARQIACRVLGSRDYLCQKV